MAPRAHHTESCSEKAPKRNEVPRAVESEEHPPLGADECRQCGDYHRNSGQELRAFVFEVIEPGLLVLVTTFQVSQGVVHEGVRLAVFNLEAAGLNNTGQAQRG